MADVVNLNRVRKAVAKVSAKADASANRALHGLTKVQKDSAKADRDRAARLTDGHKRGD